MYAASENFEFVGGVGQIYPGSELLAESEKWRIQTTPDEITV